MKTDDDQASGASTPAGSPAGSLKFLTWYNAPGDGDWLTQTHSNLLTNENLDHMMGPYKDPYNVTHNPYFMLDLHRPGPRSIPWWVQPTEWDQLGGGLRPGWDVDIAAELDQALPHIMSGKVVGIFLGDEPGSNGVPFSNISTVANFVKAKLAHTRAFVYINEASQAFSPSTAKAHPNFQGHYTYLPVGLDIISLDGYCMGDTGDP
eukprot:COSAG05_NODE_37_length_27688_cov_18.080394_4_plen_206_part_00